MAIRTGSDFLTSVNNRSLEVFLDGQRISTGLAEHPAFRPSAQAYARRFDLQRDPRLAEQLSYASPRNGSQVSTSFLVPRSHEDLGRRRVALIANARTDHGFLGRSGDYMNSALAALSAADSFFEQADPVFGERIRSYYEYVRDHHLLTAHALVTPKANRSASDSEPPMDPRIAARVVEERSDGIVIRGARMLVTNGPLADELLVFPTNFLRGAPQDLPYSYAFAIPTDTRGLSFHCQSPLRSGSEPHDEPLASRFEEIDAMVVFDDVFVPNDRVFMLGNAKLRNSWYSVTGAGALMTQQSVCRTLAKTEFFLGLAAEIADALGIDQQHQLRHDLGEMITFVEIQRALLRASEAEAETSADGLVLPRWETLNAARNWFPTQVAPRLTELIRGLSGMNLLALPGIRDLDNADERADIDRYHQSPREDAEGRIRLFRLALDASTSGFAGRTEVFERFQFGDPVRMQESLASSYDLSELRARVRELL